MKALVIINRVGQIVILAIAFMACVGWNQAAGLQNNISSVTRKRIKDIVRIRYVLPYTNLHTVPQPCSPDAAFDSQDSTNNLNNQSIWNSAEDQGKRNVQSCKGTQSLISKKQTENEIASLAAPVFCRSKTRIADVFQGRGYFSGFVSTPALAHFTDYASPDLMSTETVSPDTNNMSDDESLVDTSPVAQSIPSEGCLTK